MISTAAKVILFTLASIVVLLGACSFPAVQDTRPAARTPVQEVWPKPPAAPRIRYLKTVQGPVDLGIRPSWWERLLQAITGEHSSVQFIRPGDVAVSGDLICVADPGAQSLWLLDPKHEQFLRVQTAADKQTLVSPVAVEFGAAGNIYLADSYLGKVLIYNRAGELQSTLGDTHLQRPAGLAYDAGADRLYVSDSAAHTVRIFDRADESPRSLGRRGTGQGEFNFPTHLSVDGNGTLYVTDALGYRIQLFDRDGRFMASFGHHGNGSGDFAAPKGVAVDSEGHIYVVDALFDVVQIFDHSGQYLLSFGEHGTRPGQFWLPGGLFVDAHDNIYVVDGYNQRIQIFQYIKQDNPGG